MSIGQKKKIDWWQRVRKISPLGIVLIGLFPLSSLGEVSPATLEVKEVAALKPKVDSDLISLNFRDADIREVLRLISTYAQVNIVPDAEVTGVVTITLRDVSWERALNTVLRMHRLTFIRDENIIRVVTHQRLEEEIKREELEAQRLLKEEIKRMEELKTRTFILNFTKAAEVKESITEALSERGRIIVNERMNVLFITDTPAQLTKLEEMIKKLDVRAIQITIETRLVEVILDEREDLGIDWNIMGGITRGAARPITFPFEADRSLGDFAPAPDGVFPPMVPADFTFGVLSAEAFRAVLHLLQTRAETRILSAPNITTVSNEEARIVTADRFPVPTMAFNEERGVWEIIGYEYIDVGVILTVVPTARPGGEIVMELKPEVSEIIKEVPFLGGLTVPVVATKEVETQVTVRDGETLVIGGLMRTMEEERLSKVPLLGDVPLLGRLFRKTTQEKVKTDLLIFVTASIVKEQRSPSAHHQLRLREIEASQRLYEEGQRVEEHYLSGKEYLRQRDYGRASAEFKAALEINPKHREAQRLLRRVERSLEARGREEIEGEKESNKGIVYESLEMRGKDSR